jgi:hypothetical protein
MNSYGMLDLAVLAAWREMVHADFLFSQRRGGRKEFLRNAGLGGLSGLARDNSGMRFLFSQRRGGRKGISTECWTWRTWRLDERWFTQIFCSRKGAEDAKEFLRNAGLGGLSGLARDINDPRARAIFSQRRGECKGIPTECRTWRS